MVALNSRHNVFMKLLKNFSFNFSHLKNLKVALYSIFCANFYVGSPDYETSADLWVAELPWNDHFHTSLACFTVPGRQLHN